MAEVELALTNGLVAGDEWFGGGLVASCHSWLTTDKCHSESIRSNLGKLKVVEDKTVTMIKLLQ
ncbi:hypothetical protein CFP56_000648 [Quercus suber]|uniref:Uncharacterized protein n=1 Tax=Quercus suber TaxID=58331 RepID=A0AAW0LI02_QUESU